MHDPKTVAFDIPRPWPKKTNSKILNKKRRWWFDGYLPTLITIWHVDPERNNDEDSCDWFGMRHMPQNGWYPVHQDEYERLPDSARNAVDFMWYLWRSRMRPWYKHPRWHVHHWQIQIHPIQKLKRRLFSRCEVCGKRFPYGYAPVSRIWGGGGPRWFKNEKGIRHHDCDRASS